MEDQSNNFPTTMDGYLHRFVLDILEVYLLKISSSEQFRSDSGGAAAPEVAGDSLIFGGEPDASHELESESTPRQATTQSFDLSIAIWKCLTELLTQLDTPTSVLIKLDSGAKVLELSRFSFPPASQYMKLNLDILRHIKRLSRERTIQDQRLKDSNSLASKNGNKYPRLPETPKAIRLVVVLPATSKSAAIDCVLCHESLDNNPQYEALSYTWGDMADTRDIRVDGKSFTVTKNLFVALQHLRSRSSPRVIWIDALCINQNDIPERNHQGQQMRDIYKQASEVLIWLGPESNTTATAIHFMSEIPLWINGRYPDLLDPYDTLSRKDYVTSRLKTLLLLDDFRERWIALSQFLERPWWGRIWVSQEVAVASKMRFFCGSLVIQMPIIEDFINFWQSYHLMMGPIAAETGTIRNPFINKLYFHMIKLVVLACNRRHFQQSISQGTPVDITHLIATSSFMNSTDPRDRIFALLGMTFDSRYGDHLLVADYSLTTREVYINVTTHILRSRQTLDILNHVSHDSIEREDSTPGEAVHSLPSWVPDWSRLVGSGSIQMYSLKEGDIIYQAGLDRVSPVPIQICMDERVLVVKGVLLDSILSIGSRAGNSITSVFEQWRKLMPEADDDTCLGNQTAREAFWRTVLCDQWNMIRLSKLNNLIDGDISIPPSTVKQEHRLKSLINCGVSKPHKTKRFFRTRSGHIGIGPSFACPDDLIVVLLGGSVPYVLRKHKVNIGSYVFISDW